MIFLFTVPLGLLAVLAVALLSNKKAKGFNKRLSEISTLQSRGETARAISILRGWMLEGLTIDGLTKGGNLVTPAKLAENLRLQDCALEVVRPTFAQRPDGHKVLELIAGIRTCLEKQISIVQDKGLFPKFWSGRGPKAEYVAMFAAAEGEKSRLTQLLPSPV